MPTYRDRVTKALSRIGTANGTALPLVNDPDTAAAMQMALGKWIEHYGKGMMDDAKAVLQDRINAVDRGPAVVVNSPHVVISVATAERPGNLDSKKLMVELVRRFGVEMSEANAIIDKCRNADYIARTVSSVLTIE